jgi:anti-sigma factor RsiW
MTCREFADFLDDYLAGGLAPSVRTAFEYHLQLCVNCVRYLEHYRQAIALGRHAFDGTSTDLLPDVPEDLVRAILRAR